MGLTKLRHGERLFMQSHRVADAPFSLKLKSILSKIFFFFTMKYLWINLCLGFMHLKVHLQYIRLLLISKSTIVQVHTIVKVFDTQTNTQVGIKWLEFVAINPYFVFLVNIVSFCTLTLSTVLALLCVVSLSLKSTSCFIYFVATGGKKKS